MIFYGAPGTGKSFVVDVLTKNFNVERTTFHPESDYASFVGCYKPVSVSKGGSSLIEYKYVAQAFIRAYVNALTHPDKLQFLIIEEINRGNCAAIFGDLFQLLDRNEKGESAYAINCDSDIAAYLKCEFEACNKDVSIDLNPNLMKLPKNLYIWATMNTSDQSLFPMDSAFKRRWDMEYIRISDAGKGWIIKTGRDQYKSWYDFVEWINSVILDKTQSQDKQLGYFFIKPSGKKSRVITSRQFINKVVFYLWNDVFRDYMKSETPFDISADRGPIDPVKLKELLGKDPYIIDAFDKFFEVDTLPDFLWHLDNVSLPEEELDSSEDKEDAMDKYKVDDAILTTGKIAEITTGTIPSSVPEDWRVILHKTGFTSPYYLVKNYANTVLGLYYLSCSGLTAAEAVKLWSNAGATSAWITTNIPTDAIKWFKIGTKSGTVYLYKSTSPGHSTWNSLKNIAANLGITIIY